MKSLNQVMVDWATSQHVLYSIRANIIDAGDEWVLHIDNYYDDYYTNLITKEYSAIIAWVESMLINDLTVLRTGDAEWTFPTKEAAQKIATIVNLKCIG